MGQNVPIASITTNRTLSIDDDLTGLAQSIRDNGLQVPVLVNYDMVLIDGLRRIEAAKMLGQVTIEVVKVTLYLPALSWLRKAREHGVEARELTPRRIWEIYSVVRPLMNISKSQAMRTKKTLQGVKVGNRQDLVDALGIEKEAYLQVVTQLYRTAEEPTSKRGKIAREAVKILEEGKLTPYMAIDYLRRRTSNTGTGDADEQLQALRVASAALNGIRFGFMKLGTINPDITPEDVKDIVRDFRRFRRTLHQLIHQLDREQESDE